MDMTGPSLREAHRLLQLGVLLLLLGMITGFAISAFAVPLLGLSAHLTGVLMGIFLIVIGLLWPKLTLPRTASRIGFWMAVVGCFVSWIIAVLAGLWGAGNSVMPIVAGQAQGTAVQEAIIWIGMVSAAVIVTGLTMLVLWGLRDFTANE